MNLYDEKAIKAINDHLFKHNQFPKRIEVTPEYYAGMTRSMFTMIAPDKPIDFAALARNPEEVIHVKQTYIPVILVSSAYDRAFFKLNIENVAATLETAEAATKEEFWMLGGKLESLGLLVHDDSVQVDSGRSSRFAPPEAAYYSRLTAYVYGEQWLLIKVSRDHASGKL